MKAENSQVLLGKYAKRLAAEALLKSLIVSATAGFGVAFVVATVCWFKGTNALWLCLGILAGALILGMPILYFAAFRPTLKGNAKRIDLLGLEERTVTMVELENEDSIMSRLQREDARAHLQMVNEKMLKFRISNKLLVPLYTSGGLGCCMMVVSLLAALGLIMSGADLLGPLLPAEPVQYVYVEYWIDEGGYIEGEEFQEIVLGENTSEVMAVAEEGWYFVGWEDGNVRPERTEFGVKQDMFMVAVFEPVPEGEEGENGGGENSDDDGEPGDQSGDESGESSESEQSDPTSAGGKYEAANQVIDGQSYYRDILQQYQDLIEEYLSSSEEIPEEIRKIIETYLDIIE